MNFSSESMKRVWKLLFRGLPSAGLVLALLFLGPSVSAQSPNPAATGPAKDNPGGFTPGVTLGAKFEGSYSNDGGVYDMGSALGYNFTRHFGLDAGVPFYFVSTPSSINNPGGVSGIGVGSLERVEPFRPRLRRFLTVPGRRSRQLGHGYKVFSSSIHDLRL